MLNMPQRPKNQTLSHLNRDGEARMVDVSEKNVTFRAACASATVCMKAEVLDALLAGTLPKGEAIAAARLAGVLAAKRTGELIPLCHPLPLDWVDVEFHREREDELRIHCRAKTRARTGVEMEALTGAAVAALTIYDMAKSADKGMSIGPIQLEHKEGGKSGTYSRGSREKAGPGSTAGKRK